MSSTIDRNELLQAVNFFCTDQDAQDFYVKLLLTLQFIEESGVRVKGLGREAIINPLVNQYLENSDTFERVIDLIQTKREQAGLPALVNPADEAESGVQREKRKDQKHRNTYFSNYMFNKRDRERRLIEAWNSMRSERDKVVGTARTEWIRQESARWLNEIEHRINKLVEQEGRRPTRAEKAAIGDKVWEEVEDEIAGLEQFARDQMRLPINQRNKDSYSWRKLGLKT